MRFKEDSPYDSAINARDRYDVYKDSYPNHKEKLMEIYFGELDDDGDIQKEKECVYDIRNMSIEELKSYSKHHHFTQEELHYIRYNNPEYIIRTSGIEYQIDEQEYKDRTH